MIKNRPTRVARAATVFAACVTGCLWAAPLSAQTTLTERSQSSRVHLLGGGFVGRFDLDGAGRTDVFGGQAGIGWGELLQLTGFYWRGFDRSDESVTADRAWGGELQFNLNSGFGLTPFLTGGVARVKMEEGAEQTAALAGAGLTLPLWRVLLHVAARDYMFGVSGLENDASPEDVTHNWLYSAGVKFALGQRRRETTVVTAAPPDDRAVQAARAELTARAELAALRDSVRLGAGQREAPAWSLADSNAARRNYQSSDRIEIPLPTEGSITLRYGPERGADAMPIIVTVPDISTLGDATVGQAYAPPPPTPGATLADPATQAWLRQQVAAQVAQQLSRTTGEASTLTPAQLDAVTRRVVDGVVASLLPRLEAAQARRIEMLREDLRVMQQQQQRASRANFAAEPFAVAPQAAPWQAAPAQATPPQAAQAPATPAPVAPTQVAVEPAAVASAPAPAPASPTEDAGIAAERAEAAVRTSLAAVVAAHPAHLTARETERGPAAVVGETAFGSGAALLSSDARRALATLAAALRERPDRNIYIQGYTDSVGEELANQRLSELRAEAVRSLLVQEGVAADRLFAFGYGQARPVADNGTPQGRAQNRRVEIVIGESRLQGAR